jgi:hypothetical protein
VRWFSVAASDHGLTETREAQGDDEKDVQERYSADRCRLSVRGLGGLLCRFRLRCVLLSDSVDERRDGRAAVSHGWSSTSNGAHRSSVSDAAGTGLKY